MAAAISFMCPSFLSTIDKRIYSSIGCKRPHLRSVCCLYCSGVGEVGVPDRCDYRAELCINRAESFDSQRWCSRFFFFCNLFH
uniref:Uncharacterized protein n=1 Tax=Salmonella sp. TaxID=599 RepID=A0A482EVL5_SALSP|nr:hypothetical protein NNIBIDOC_00143 [Salmonella sp.]